MDAKQLVIDDLTSTLDKIERALRAAGTIEFKEYHNARDRELASEFIRMADDARSALKFAQEMKLYGY